MKTYEIDWRIARCFFFIAIVNAIVSIILLFHTPPAKGFADTSVISQISTMVCIYALLAGAYGISATRGAERVFSIALCVMFFVMLNIEANSKFLGFDVISTSALSVAGGLVFFVVRTEPATSSACLMELLRFTFSRNSILLVAALAMYTLARTNERILGGLPQTGWSWLIHQASLMSVMVLFLYAACPYLKRETLS
ncbi:hypothetical protein [Ciceribacter sp. T2.26MG-112.2]|uniref:hypothetical protein n=1 Tax=Ciceribacter sp. T2.26MG-112.2 TaxID=3137154 RepID=UPI0012B693DB|nr:hypothetical protein [Ciceribacter naphthalenivorans]